MLMFSTLPLFVVVIPMALVLVLVSCREPNVREGWTLAAAGAAFLLVASMVPDVLAGRPPSMVIARVLPGISVALSVDAFGLLFALVASSLWIVTTVYSIGYMRGLKEHSQTRYYSFFALSVGAALGVAFSANLFTLYLFYEMLSFATYPLVTHHQDREARASGRKYLAYILGSSICLVLPAMLIVYWTCGTLTFADGGIMGTVTASPFHVVLLMAFVFGFAKAAVMPFHAWLPAAMVAPTPVSALLHAVAVVKVGAFSIVRVITGTFGTDWLAALPGSAIAASVAAATVLIASLIALSQDGLKRRLAFSTIGQLAYIVMGAAMLSPRGLTGAMLHIAMHAVGKITLFFCAGAIFVATGITSIRAMAGIGRRMPVTMAAFLVGSMSVIGLPPCGGFISKWFLALGSLEADRWGLLVVLLGSSLLNAAYFLPIVYRAFFVGDSETAFPKRIEEAPRWCVVPPVVTAVACVALFFFPQPFLALARLAAVGMTGG